MTLLNGESSSIRNLLVNFEKGKLKMKDIVPKKENGKTIIRGLSNKKGIAMLMKKKLFT